MLLDLKDEDDDTAEEEDEAGVEEKNDDESSAEADEAGIAKGLNTTLDAEEVDDNDEEHEETGRE